MNYLCLLSSEIKKLKAYTTTAGKINFLRGSTPSVPQKNSFCQVQPRQPEEGSGKEHEGRRHYTEFLVQSEVKSKITNGMTTSSMELISLPTPSLEIVFIPQIPRVKDCQPKAKSPNKTNAAALPQAQIQA